MESDTQSKTADTPVQESLKHLFVSLCRLHKQNNFNRYESIGLHNALDDYYHRTVSVPNMEEVFSESRRKKAPQEYDSVIHQMHERLNDVTKTNNELTEQLNMLLTHNKTLEEKVEKLEQVPVVKLVPKDKQKEPIIISRQEFEYLQELKSKISVLQERYDTLAKEEHYDERLLANYKERIDLLKEKLLERSRKQKQN